VTITAAGLAGSTGYEAQTTGTHSVGSITSGQLLVVVCGSYASPNQPFVLGDISKTAGTATLGSFALDKAYDNGLNAHTAIWSAIVTGTGTCTVTVSNRPSGAYFDIGAEAFNGSWDGSRAEASNGASGSGTTAVSSGNATSAGAAVFVGVFDDVTGATSYTKDAAFTQLYVDAGSPNNSGSIYRIVSSGTTDAAEWTANASIDSAAAVVVYKEIAGGSVVGAASNYYRQAQ
jgi:hypothetical protein